MTDEELLKLAQALRTVMLGAAEMMDIISESLPPEQREKMESQVLQLVGRK